MISRTYTNLTVVEAARERVKQIFRVAPKVYFCISGGKDSICLNDIIYKLCKSGEIDKSKLIIQFIDEEAIFPCVEKQVKMMRMQWLELGVTFNWWCIEVRHFNCLNSLTNDESFIIWDHDKKDVWIRPMPKFAITDHPLLRKRKDTYQDFLRRIHIDGVVVIGLRASESVQRLSCLAKKKSKQTQYPIFDWENNDIWKYIRDNNLSFPEAYMYMWQVGVGYNHLRISQFFSVDTIRTLTQMCEYYPDLYDKICKREPNAYMAMLYFDTEFFRHSKKNRKKDSKEKDTDYKKKTLDLMKQKERFNTPSQKTNYRTVGKFINFNSLTLNNDHWKKLYEALVGGDPKGRVLRAMRIDVTTKSARKAEKDIYERNRK